MNQSWRDTASDIVSGVLMLILMAIAIVAVGALR